MEIMKAMNMLLKHQWLAIAIVPIRNDETKNYTESYLDWQLQTILTDTIFKAAFNSLQQLAIKDSEKAENIIQFVSSFLKFGDGFRRLIAISLTIDWR